MANLEKSTWTKKLKAAARKELLDIANCYEVTTRKILKGVIFYNSGMAKYYGHAHDYTVWISSL